MRSATSELHRVNTGTLRGRADGWLVQSCEFLDAAKKREIAADSCANSEAGTPIAVIPIPLGCAPSPPNPPLFKHGGARNHASRTSHGLTLFKAQKMAEAAQKAHAIGRPLNRHITVHWEAAGITDAEAMAATTAFLKYLREWLGNQTAYIWVRENGDGKGSHVHILAHIPECRKLSGALSKRWIERITGKRYRAGAIHSRMIAGSRQPEGPLYAENLATTLAYVLKGTEPDAAAALGIARKYGGQVIGKRCGTSRNLGVSLCSAGQSCDVARIVGGADEGKRKQAHRGIP